MPDQQPKPPAVVEAIGEVSEAFEFVERATVVRATRCTRRNGRRATAKRRVRVP